jgi:dynamin 1-like protein
MLLIMIPGYEQLESEENSLTEREELETSFIQLSIATYFNIVRQTIQDLIPKVRGGKCHFSFSDREHRSFLQAIMHLLVNNSKDSVQNRLVTSLYRESLFADLLYEDENLTAERNRVKALLDA